MKVDFIRREVNEALSEDGGAFITLVNKSTVGLETSIKEAIAQLYCVGEPSLIEGYFTGIMRSIFEGIKADGHPRTVGDITFFPACGGTFDLDTGWNSAVNDVRIHARLSNGVTLDVSDWEFNDVTDGRVSFTIENIGNGEVTGVVTSDKNVEVNGRNFPSHDDLTINWVCGTKSGTVAATAFTSNVSRIDIDKSAFASLTAEETGEDLTIVVKGCYNKASKTVTFTYVAPTGPVVSKGYSSTHESDIGGIYDSEVFYLEGERLTDATVKMKYTSEGTEYEQTAPAEFMTVTATKITLDSAFVSSYLPGVETGASVCFTVSNSLGSTSYYATKRA